MRQHFFLFTVFLVFCPLFMLGQKSKVLSAYKHHQVYMSNKKCSELAGAKTAIDEAVNDLQTSQWAKTWYYRGNIYFDISVSEDKGCNELSDSALSIAYEAYIKALELDIKKHYTTDIQTRLAVIGPYFLNQGVKLYNDEAYAGALACFEKSAAIAKVFNKTDSLSIYNAALSAEQLKDFEKARHYYQELIKIGYGGAKTYSFLANTYVMQGDTANQIAVLSQGRQLYPQDQNLIIETLNYYLEHEAYEEALTILNIVIDREPGNYLMHYYQGAVYDNLKAYDKAASAYAKSLVLKPDYFDANYNMGVLYFNQGVELNEEAFSENGSEEKKKAARKKFEKALPYLEKANSLNAYDRSTLISLQKIYSILGNDAGYKRVTEELEN